MELWEQLFSKVHFKVILTIHPYPSSPFNLKPTKGRIIAVKKLLKDNKDLASKEIDILIKLQHKNIIKYYYFEETNNHILLGLEKCVCSM